MDFELRTADWELATSYGLLLIDHRLPAALGTMAGSSLHDELPIAYSFASALALALA